MFNIIGNRHYGIFATCETLDAARLIADSLNLNINGTINPIDEIHWSYFWVVDKDNNES
jgi:hypothetical protein